MRRRRAALAALVGTLAAVTVMETTARLAEGLWLHRQWRAPAPPAAPFLELFGFILVQRDRVLGFRLQPHAQTALYHINAQGFRGAVVALPKPRGVYRVVALGGSTTFGWGVGDDQTYPRALEDLLNHACALPGIRRIEVLNGGVPGYTSAQDVRSFHAHWVAYQPDVILVMTGFNDILGTAIGAIEDETDAWRLPEEGAATYSWSLAHSAAVRWAERWAWQGQDLGARVEEAARRPVAPAVSDKALPQAQARAWQRVRWALEGLRGLSQAHQCRLVLLGHPGMTSDVFKAQSLPVEHAAAVSRLIRDGYEPLFTHMAAWAEHHDVPFIDLREALSASPVPVFQPDGIHFTAEGNARVARAVAQQLFPSACAPLQAQVQASTQRAVAYLAAAQQPDGEWLAATCRDAALADCVAESAIPATAFAVAAISRLGDPAGRVPIARGTAFLERQVRPDGFVRFHGTRFPQYEVEPDELSVTALTHVILAELGRAVPSPREALLSCQRPDGLFYPYRLPAHAVDGVGDPQDKLWAEIPSPQGRMLVPPDLAQVSPLVNACLLNYLAAQRQPASGICALLREVMARDAQPRNDVFLETPLMTLKMASDAYRRGAQCLEPARASVIRRLLEDQRPDGSWGGTVDTASAIHVLSNFNARSPAADRGVQWLLAAQQPDGSWPRDLWWAFYFQPFRWYGSDTLTTIQVLDALARFLEA